MASARGATNSWIARNSDGTVWPKLHSRGGTNERPALERADGSPLPAAAQQFPPHVAQHVADLVQQLVRPIEPTRGFGTAARLAVSLLPLFDAGEYAGDVRDRCHLAVLRMAARQPPISTIRRTGRLLTPSIPVSSSAFPALPPQPS